MSGPRSWSTTSVTLSLIKLGPVFVLIGLIIIFALVAPAFTNWENVKNVMLQSSPIALLAVGQLVVVLTRGIDISSGSNLGLSTVVGALVGTHVSSSPVVVIAAMVASGAAVGLVNATIIVRLGINNPFIVTLAMLSVVYGAAILASGEGGQSVAGIPAFVTRLATGATLGIPTAFVLALAVSAGAAVFLRRTLWGRWIYAIGGDPDAAKRVGIPTGAVLATCYVFAGACAGVAGLLIAGRFGSGFPEAGRTMELDAISAVIIGGASFFGGRGGVSAALLGALIIGVMRNGLNVAGVVPEWQLMAVGAILVCALGLDKVRARVEERARATKGRLAEEGHDESLDRERTGTVTA